MTMPIENRTTCCFFAPEIRLARSWPRPFSIAPGWASSGRFPQAASRRAGFIRMIDLLKKLHYDVSGLRSKSWKEFSGPDAPKLDFVFTVCDNAAKEPCPVWPGQPMTAHWGVPDPAEATGNEAEVRFAFADTLRMLTNRINIFISLPLKSLDQLTLQKQLEAIGKTKDATDKPASAA